jgi:hypothetical protein
LIEPEVKMSDSRTAYEDDFKAYLSLCKEFGENPDPAGPYGHHAQLLEKLRASEEPARKELDAARNKSRKLLAEFKSLRSKLTKEEFETLLTLMRR